MILKPLEIKNNIDFAFDHNQKLSLEFLISFLRDKIANGEDYETGFPKLVLERIYQLQKEYGEINETSLHLFKEIFNYIYYLTSNVLIKEEVMWGLGFPLPNQVFFGQEQFYAIVQSDLSLIDERLSTPFYSDFHFNNKILYLLVLQRFYDVPTVNFKQFYQYVDQNGIKKYYQLHIDYTFLDIKPIGDLPECDLSILKDKEIKSFDDLVPFLNTIDLSLFHFTGFTILKFFDKTQERISDRIQDLITQLPNFDVLTDLSEFDSEYFQQEISDVIYTLTETKEIKSSFLPLLELNGVPILSSELSKDSIFFKAQLEKESDVCQSAMFAYLKNPTTITYGVKDGFVSGDELFIDSLRNSNLKSYVCIPLNNKEKLVGFLELYSYSINIDKQQVVNVAPFISLFANWAVDLVSTFKASIDKVILDKFTSLQDSVQWRFNQVAANYIEELSLKHRDVQIPKITFEKVYPLYGAVDIRNSTKLRNMAYKKDSFQRIALLQLIVDQLENGVASQADSKFIQRFNLVKSWLDEGQLDQLLLDILSFFQDEVIPFLETLDVSDPVLGKLKDKYIAENFGPNGVVDGASEQFEKSLSILNEIINKELSEFNHHTQQKYPSYFEKFRTDGIEYDMYIGQSITPHTSFDAAILADTRKQQILSMIRIAKDTFNAMIDLPIALVTTQLIFIHPNPIDISFRQDERRFDVEGGYNIRYEVIKKRIDKAKVKDTNERLVQPNKIAIVYSSVRVEEDIKLMLNDLLSNRDIVGEIEHLVLDELQGIEDLKAFRISVPLEV